jgi:hypothetical protein
VEKKIPQQEKLTAIRRNKLTRVLSAGAIEIRQAPAAPLLIDLNIFSEKRVFLNRKPHYTNYITKREINSPAAQKKDLWPIN